MLDVKNNNYLQELVTTAGDAFNNLYIAEFLGKNCPGLGGGTGNGRAFQRCALFVHR